MKILKILGIGIVALGVVAALVFATRTNPLGPIAGRALTGEVVIERVTDWSFADEYYEIGVESRPAAPHSVTTHCIVREGKLYVAALDASIKDWPYFVVADPRVRVKLGNRVYPVRATRLADASLEPDLVAIWRQKYIGGDDEAEVPSMDDVWVFQLESRVADENLGDRG